jgi:Protein of unknown function (DUF2505)
MTEFSIAHEFESDPETFWRVFLDGKFLEEWYGSAGLNREEVSREAKGDQVIVVARYISQNQPPALVRSVLGGKQFGYVETATFTKGVSHFDQKIEPTVVADRVRFDARFSVEPIGPKRVRQTYAGVIAVNIPLLGKKLEQATVKEMERTHTVAANVTRAWLGRA